MQIDFSPKAHFLRTKDAIVKDLAKVVQSDNFHEAVGVALQQWVMDRTPEANVIRGVKEFIATLMDLPHERQAHAPLRTPQLDHSIYQRPADPLAVHSTKP